MDPLFDNMLDTSMYEDKENTGYFRDDETFDVDTLDGAAKRNDDAECNDDLIDIDAEENP